MRISWSRVVSAVLAVPGSDFDADPVEDPPAVCSRAARTALPFQPWQAGKQVVDGVVAVSGVRRHPAERDLVGDGPADHRLGHGHLRLEADRVVDARPSAPFPVVRPGRGQIQAPVDERASAICGVGEEHPDLAVLGASGGAGVLPLHAGRADALLQEAGVIDDEDGLAVTEVFDDVVAYVVQDLVGVPLDPVQQPMDAIGTRVQGFLRQRPSVLALQRRSQAPQ